MEHIVIKSSLDSKNILYMIRQNSQHFRSNRENKVFKNRKMLNPAVQNYVHFLSNQLMHL